MNERLPKYVQKISYPIASSTMLHHLAYHHGIEQSEELSSEGYRAIKQLHDDEHEEQELGKFIPHIH